MKQIQLHQLPYETVSHNSAIQKKVLLRSGSLPHLTNFAQAYFEPGQVADCHVHLDMSEVFFVQSGDGEIWIDQVRHPLLPGTCIVVEAGEHHEVRNSGKEQLVLIYFGIVTNIVQTSPTENKFEPSRNIEMNRG